jgi:hypothetical protein
VLLGFIKAHKDPILSIKYSEKNHYTCSVSYDPLSYFLSGISNQISTKLMGIVIQKSVDPALQTMRQCGICYQIQVYMSVSSFYNINLGKVITYLPCTFLSVRHEWSEFE